MTAQSPSYTPSQYLEAARRAEAEGRVEHAVQFYRYLAEQHGGTAEGLLAREGLFRLRSETTNPTQRPVAPQPFDKAPAPTLTPPQQTGPAAISQPPFHAPARLDEPATRRGEGRLPRAIAKHDPELAALELPPPVEGYMVGRVVARLVGLLGWLMMLVGIGLSVQMLVGSFYDKRALAMFAAVPMLAWLGPMLLATGAMIGLLSQLVRAQFDTAAATRDLAAIERAKAEL